MSAPKTPVATSAPSSRRAPTNASTSGSLTGRGAAALQAAAADDRFHRLLEEPNAPALTDPAFPAGAWVNFFRRDDYSSVAYFYLDRPTTDLPALSPVEARTADLRKAVQQKKLVLTARVPDDGAAVEYLGKDSAWVLVSVDVHTESAGSSPEDSRYRTRVVLDKDGDDWLVSRLERVG